ncbi:MAG: hypothetical protein EOP93_20530, partial [Lysobacteraceae bacterium]
MLVLLLMAPAMPVHAAPGLLLPGLLLEVSLNGKSSGTVVQVTREDGRLLLTADDFEKLGLSLDARADGDGRTDLSRIAGLSAQVDDTGQRLLLTVTAKALPRQTYDLGAGAASVPAPRSDSGAILRYDLSAGGTDRLGRSVAGGASFSLDVFTPDARIANSGFVTANALGVRPVRLDSALVLERPDRLFHVVIGDAISVTPGWGRAAEDIHGGGHLALAEKGGQRLGDKAGAQSEIAGPLDTAKAHGAAPARRHADGVADNDMEQPVGTFQHQR